MIYTALENSRMSDSLSFYNRSKELLRTINLYQGIMAGAAFPLWIILYFIIGQITFLFVAGLVVLNASLCTVTLFLARSKFRSAVIIAVVNHLVVMTLAVILLGTSAGGVVSMYFWIPVLVSILGLPTGWLIGSTIITIVFIGVNSILQDAKIVKPVFEVTKEVPFINIIAWMMTLCLLLIGLVVFTRRLNFAIATSERESMRVEEQNRQLATVTNTAQEISTHASSLSNEITATISQQASGAAQQAQAVLEITANMEQMNQSAQQIADNTEQVVKAAYSTLDIARTVVEENARAVKVTSVATEAVEETTSNFDKLNNRIQTVGQTLLRLSQYSREISTVLDVLNGFSDETQLLSLNAAIEAAGAGELGQRFGVVAQEIKRLAESSRQSNEEVRQILSTLQELIAQAVMAAEESRKESGVAAERVKKTGDIMHEITTMVEQTRSELSRIVDFAEDTTTLSQTISLATRQQQSASSQIVATMQNIKDVAQQTAGATKVVSSSVQQLSDLTHRLTNTLAA
jgi:methyl-accepting chemotaxis protein